MFSRLPRSTKFIFLLLSFFLLSACGGDDNTDSGGGNNIDTTPDTVTFQAVTEADADTVFESNEVTITGINTSIPLTISNGEYSLNGSDYSTLPVNVVSGNRLKVRVTTGNQLATEYKASVTLGNKTSVFSVTTKEKASGQFVFGPVEGLKVVSDGFVSYTDAQGNYETTNESEVSFYIGELKLGDTVAVGFHSPFSLLGLDPALTHEEVTNWKNLLKIDMVFPVDKAANIIHLLTTLDEDADLTNGIKIPLAVHDIPIVNNLNLEYKAARFNLQPGFVELINKARQTNQWTSDIPFLPNLSTLNFAYNNMNLNAREYRAQTVLIDTDNDGLTDNVEKNTYNAYGQFLSQTVYSDALMTTKSHGYTYSYSDDWHRSQISLQSDNPDWPYMAINRLSVYGLVNEGYSTHHSTDSNTSETHYYLTINRYKNGVYLNSDYAATRNTSYIEPIDLDAVNNFTNRWNVTIGENGVSVKSEWIQFFEQCITNADCDMAQSTSYYDVFSRTIFQVEQMIDSITATEYIESDIVDLSSVTPSEESIYTRATYNKNGRRLNEVRESPTPYHIWNIEYNSTLHYDQIGRLTHQTFDYERNDDITPKYYTETRHYEDYIETDVSWNTLF